MDAQMEVPDWWRNPDLEGLDRRTRRTRTALFQAMARLMREKSLMDITVRELTDAADVSRSAFYANFSSTRALFDEMHRGFREAVAALVRKNADDMRRYRFRPILKQLYDYFNRNEEVFELVFGSGEGDSFFSEWADVLRDTGVEAFCPEGAHGAKRTAAYQIEFIAHGSAAVARSWMEGGSAG